MAASTKKKTAIIKRPEAAIQKEEENPYGRHYTQLEMFHFDKPKASVGQEVTVLRVLVDRLMDQLGEQEDYGKDERDKVRLVISLCNSVGHLSTAKTPEKVGNSPLDALRCAMQAQEERWKKA
jgi:hypothetical protein